MTTENRPRVAVAVPFDDVLIARLARDDRIELLYEPDLLAPRRHVADFAGDPSFVRTAPQQRRYEELLASADILFGVPDTDPAVLGRTIQANPGVRWLHTMAAGGGSQVRDAALSPQQLARLRVSTSAGVHGHALAEFAVLGLLQGIKDAPRWERDKAARRWPDRRPVRQLRDATVLVLGSGGIGSAVARLLEPFGARVWMLVRDPARAVKHVERTITMRELAEAAGSVDAVVAALPDTPRTRGLVDAALLVRLRPGAIVVNVGRGTVVDEGALIAALQSGRVSFAALDVFEREPLPSASPLWTHERVLLSPHTAALDAGEEERILELFLDNLGRFLGGRPLRNEMNSVEFY